MLTGKSSWVGYTGHTGVFAPSDLAPGASAEFQNRLMIRYMRRYKTATDAAILLRNWNRI